MALQSCFKIPDRKEIILHIKKHVSESFIYGVTNFEIIFLLWRIPDQKYNQYAVPGGESLKLKSKESIYYRQAE